MREFQSNGMLWNDGDIPCCSYCNKSIDEVYTLHETPYSGELCCDSQECREDLLNAVLSCEVEEIESTSRYHSKYDYERKAFDDLNTFNERFSYD